MMKTRLLSAALITTLLALGLTVAPSTADAHPRKNGPFGIGIILNEPTGATGKYFFNDMMALDFHLGVQGLDNGRHDDFGIYVDFLFHFDVGGNFNWGSIPLYLGPGLALIFDDDDRFCTRFGCYDDDGDDDLHLALRMPFGVAFWFSKFGGEAFVELALSLFVTPRFDADLDIATGFRYYF